MEYIEISAKTVNDAITEACKRLGVTSDKLEYEVKEEKFEEKSSFVAVWAIVAVGAIGIVYVIFEYRKEIAGLFRKKGRK